MREGTRLTLQYRRYVLTPNPTSNPNPNPYIFTQTLDRHHDKKNEV